MCLHFIFWRFQIYFDFRVVLMTKGQDCCASIYLKLISDILTFEHNFEFWKTNPKVVNFYFLLNRMKIKIFTFALSRQT